MPRAWCVISVLYQCSHTSCEASCCIARFTSGYPTLPAWPRRRQYMRLEELYRSTVKSWVVEVVGELVCSNVSKAQAETLDGANRRMSTKSSSHAHSHHGSLTNPLLLKIWYNKACFTITFTRLQNVATTPHVSQRSLSTSQRPPSTTFNYRYSPILSRSNQNGESRQNSNSQSTPPIVGADYTLIATSEKEG